MTVHLSRLNNDRYWGPNMLGKRRKNTQTFSQDIKIVQIAFQFVMIIINILY